MIDDKTRLRLMRVALGKESADTVVLDAKIVSVTSGDIFKASIAVKSSFIALVGDAEHTIGESTKVIEAKGAFVVPGFIDGHLHIESTMLTPSQFAKITIPCGTTAVFADFHEIGNVLGPRGIKLMIDDSQHTPMKLFVIAPSTPATEGFETLGFEFGVEDLKELLRLENVAGIDEISNTGRVFGEEPVYLSKISAAIELGKVVDGSIPEVVGKFLNGMACMGIKSDHETGGLEAVLERLRLGMRVMIRLRNLKDLAKILVDEIGDSRRFILVSDDIHPDDLQEKGHLNYILRRAVEYGIDPITALQMVTINTAEHFGYDGLIGSVTPGRTADLVFLNDLTEFEVTQVLVDGEIVAEDGHYLQTLSTQPYPEWCLRTFHFQRQLGREDFIIKSDKTNTTKVRVIELDNSGSKGSRIETLRVDDHKIVPDIERDIVKISVIERHGKTDGPAIAKGFVYGLGIKKGAIGSSVAHDAHNIVVVGTNDSDMTLAVNRIIESQGGIVIVKNLHVLGELKLSLAGIICLQPVEYVVEELKTLHGIVNEELGVTISSPLMALSFETIAPRPWLKLTDKGLFDGTRILPLEIE